MSTPPRFSSQRNSHRTPGIGQNGRGGCVNQPIQNRLINSSFLFSTRVHSLSLFFLSFFSASPFFYFSLVPFPAWFYPWFCCLDPFLDKRRTRPFSRLFCRQGEKWLDISFSLPVRKTAGGREEESRDGDCNLTMPFKGQAPHGADRYGRVQVSSRDVGRCSSESSLSSICSRCRHPRPMDALMHPCVQ